VSWLVSYGTNRRYRVRFYHEIPSILIGIIRNKWEIPSEILPWDTEYLDRYHTEKMGDTRWDTTMRYKVCWLVSYGTNGRYRVRFYHEVPSNFIHTEQMGDTGRDCNVRYRVSWSVSDGTNERYRVRYLYRIPSVLIGIIRNKWEIPGEILPWDTEYLDRYHTKKIRDTTWDTTMRHRVLWLISHRETYRVRYRVTYQCTRMIGISRKHREILMWGTCESVWLCWYRLVRCWLSRWKSHGGDTEWDT